MKALVVYESMFGNTESVASSIGDGLASHLDVEVVSVDRMPVLDEQDIDLLVVGGPTHAFSMSRPQTRLEAVAQGAPGASSGTGIREWLAALPASRTGLRVAAFDTRVERARRLPGSAARKAAKVVVRLGYRRAAGSESFYVADSAGPLLDGELDRARAWGERLAAETSARELGR